MPYKYPDNIPPNIKNLPKDAQKIWIATFNAVYNNTHSDNKARSAAWHSVKLQYIKRNSKWVKKHFTIGLIKTRNDYVSFLSVKKGGLSDYVQKAESDMQETFFDVMVTMEEKFYQELKNVFDKEKKKVFDNFKLLETAYETTDEVGKMSNYLNENISYIDPKVTYKQVGIFRFEKNIFPIEVKEYFDVTKNIIPEIIRIISSINLNPFKKVIYNNIFKSHKMGGETAFSVFNLKFDFNILDKNIIKAIENLSIQLAKGISDQISSRIKFELLEGVKNNESIRDLRKRILNVWNRPIQVNVKPLYDNKGNIIRSGYNYELSQKAWANTVARTETARAFTAGKIDGWRQSGVVEKAEYSTAGDERTCPICEPLDGLIVVLESADDLIPQHANCRCTLIPILYEAYDYNSASFKAADNLAEIYVS